MSPLASQSTQSCGQIDRLTRYTVDAVINVHLPQDHQAGIDAGMHGQRFTDTRFAGRIQAGHEVVYFTCGPDRPDRIVFRGA